jgi:hypothetical protein
MLRCDRLLNTETIHNKMSWILDLFGFNSGQNGVLVLQPDASAKQLAGFKSGAALELTASPGETIASVMDKFNTYRGPEQQIEQLWDVEGRPLAFSTVITGRLIAIVRAV